MRYSNGAKRGIQAFFALSLMLVILCLGCCAQPWPTIIGHVDTLTTPSGDWLTSPAPPGNSSRAARPPGPGAVLFHENLAPPFETWLATWYANDDGHSPLEISSVPGPYLNLIWEPSFPENQGKALIQEVLLIRNVYLKGGPYRFFMWAEGDVRLQVNERLIITQDNATKGRPLVGDIWLDRAGPVPIELSYRANGPQGYLRAYWERTEWFSGWRGEYYANRYLTGEPALVRNDPILAFTWGKNAPAINLPEDDFSVRWSRIVTFSPGRYRFTVTANEGVRLYLDDALLINAWHEIGPEPLEEEIFIHEGTHQILVEYFDHKGEAYIILSWQRIQ